MPTYLLLTWDGNGTGYWGMFNSRGGKGVGRDANGMGWACCIEEVGNSVEK